MVMFNLFQDRCMACSGRDLMLYLFMLCLVETVLHYALEYLAANLVTVHMIMPNDIAKYSIVSVATRNCSCRVLWLVI
jgi:hypothetical protein